jgi:hypothetical protein
MKKAVFSVLPFKQVQPEGPQQWVKLKGLRKNINTSVSISGLLTHIRNQGLPNINQ